VNLRSTNPTNSPAAPAPGSGPAPAKAGHGFTTLADVAASASATGTASLPEPRKLGGMALLIVVGIVAATVLFAMRQFGMTRRIEMLDFKIDYPIEKAEMIKLSKDHEEVLRELHSSGELVQVPLEQVQTNPFEWKLAEKRVKSEDKDDAALEAELALKAAEALKKKIEGRVAQMKLNGVMGGRVPVANISGTIVKVGDVFEETFTVKAIEGRTVSLEAEGMAFTLEMAEKKDSPKR
jgi:hypothetical protein